MKKRTLALVLAAVFSVGAVSSIGAANLISEIKAELRRDFTIRVDGKKQNFKNVQGEDVFPILYDGTTYLPVRAIGELMNKTVYWDEGKLEIDLRSENTDKTTTVTDADVIFDSTDNSKKDKPQNPKPDKAKKTQKQDKYADKEEFIGKDKAKEIALKKAGLKESEAKFVKAELDFDNGIHKYEIEIKSGSKEYEADINAVNGEIIKWEVDFFD